MDVALLHQLQMIRAWNGYVPGVQFLMLAILFVNWERYEVV